MADHSVSHVIARRFRIPVLFLMVAVAYGTAGYMVIEDYNPLDALYMTVITLASVGFSEIHPLSSAGRGFTITLIGFGVMAVFNFLAVLTTLLGTGQLTKLMERKAVRKSIDSLRDHYVICAFGRVGRAAAQELKSQGADLVVVEVRAELEPDLIEAGVPFLIADPTREAVLEEAGIRRAKGLLCAVDSDAINVYITLTARAMNPDLFIISRASSPESVDKLTHAGSNRVVSPYLVSGVRMASMAMRPAVLEFTDMVRVAPDLRIEELIVGETSQLDSRTVREVCAPYPGVMILAIRKPAGDLLVPPQADSVLGKGDLLILVGKAGALGELAEQAS